MTKIIEVLSPEDPFFKSVAEKCAINTWPYIYDNETGELLKIYLPKEADKNYRTKKD